MSTIPISEVSESGRAILGLFESLEWLFLTGFCTKTPRSSQVNLNLDKNMLKLPYNTSRFDDSSGFTRFWANLIFLTIFGQKWVKNSSFWLSKRPKMARPSQLKTPSSSQLNPKLAQNRPKLPYNTSRSHISSAFARFA